MPQHERELAEVRAEIERLRSRNKMLDTAIAEMTEEQAALCAEGQSITELVAAKDKLVERYHLGKLAAMRIWKMKKRSKKGERL